MGDESSIEWARRNPLKKIFSNKKSGAKAAGIEFTLKFEEMVWPEYCPVLGIKLRYERYCRANRCGGPDSPSFDRLDPNKGYVPGNVVIVSHRANTIKNNATVEELERVASFYRQMRPA